MNKEEFIKFWEDNFPKVNIIHYQLRTTLKDRWVRFHNLPESKRYPENEYENNLILKRQNALITDLVGENNSLIILINIGDNKLKFKSLLPLENLTEIDGIVDNEEDSEDIEENEWYRNQAIIPLKWEEGIIDKFLLKIADDSLDSPIIIELKNKRLISPYDGGIDVILENKEKKDYYKNKYKEWLSKHPKGL
jgi:hypothetical protein